MGKDHSERTPLLQQLPPIPTILNDEEENDTRIISCDNHPHNRKVMVRRSFILFLIVSILSVITVYSIRIYSNIESTVNESLELTVKDIEFDGINTEDKSIKLILDVDSSLNYSNTNFDFVTQKFLILNSYLIDNLNVDIDDINITLSTDQENWIDSIGLVKMEPFNLKIYQGVTDHLRLRVSIQPNSTSVFKTLKDIIISKKIVEMKGEFLLKIKVGYLRIPIKNMRLNFNDVVIDPTDLINEVYGHHLQLEKVEIAQDKVESSLVVKSTDKDDPILTRYINYIPSIPDFIYVDLQMLSGDKWFSLIEFKLSGLSGFLKQINNNLLNLSFANSIPGFFFTKNSDGSASPLSRLIQSIAYKDITTSLMFKSSKKNEKLFPIWVSQEILNKIAIPYHIPSLSTYSTTGNIIQNVSISNLDLSIDNGIDRPQLRSGDVKFGIAIPSIEGLQKLEVSNLKGFVDLKYENMKFGYMNITNWLECLTLSDLNYDCKFDQNDIIVTDGQIYGELIGYYLMGNGDLQIQVEFIIDALVRSGFFYKGNFFEINGLKGSGTGGL